MTRLISWLLAFLFVAVAAHAQTYPTPTYTWVKLNPQGGTPGGAANGVCWTQTDGLHCFYNGSAHGPWLVSGDAIPLTVGTTTIGSGTSGRVLYDNAGLLGEYTATQLTAQLNTFTSSLKGAAPLSGGGTANFLRADGTWAVPAGTATGTVTTTGSPASGNLTKFSGATAITNGDLSGDATTSGALALTLATVNTNTGTWGDGTHVGAFTVNGKGLITAASSVAITGAAPTGSASGDLSGSYPGPTVAKVNGVAFGASPSTSTVPVVTGANTVTYEAVPVTAGGTGLASGTSGGVLAFTAAGTLASSGALTAGLPVVGGGAGVAPSSGTRSGNTTEFVTTTGAQTNGNCVTIDASGNHVDLGAPCGTGSGSVTSVGVGSSGSTILPTNTPVLSSGTINVEINLGHANTWSAAQSFGSGDLKLNGAVSGAITLNAASAAGTNTITLPAGTTDFSGTGGTSQVVKQTSSGGAFTVAQLACSDLSNGASGCSTATGTSGATIPLLNGANTWSGVQSVNSGDLALMGATSGTITLNAAATAGTNTITLPAGTTDFSGTGGTSQVVKQTSSGGALTVAQLACGDLSNSGTGCTTTVGTSATVNTGTSGATIPLLNAKNTWSNSQAGSVTTLAISTATFTPDATNNHYYILLVHASCPCTVANPSPSFVAGTTGVIEVQQSATGSDTIGTWGSSYEAPSGTAAITLSTGANAIDVLAYYVIDATHILLIPSLNFSH